MTGESEPRALSAALSAPAFVTRGHGVALHAANRHVERWAPEASAGRVRPMRSLGFVDRLVAPWIETAQRSASLRLFSQYAQTGMGERSASAVSWVFPRPWYQDELDWMAAARQVQSPAAPTQAAPTLLTTRGTYVPSAAAAPQVAMPSALYEYVAPSLSIAASQPAAIQGVGFGGETMARGEVYSPLISLASVQAAELMSRTVASLAAQRRGSELTATSAMTPGLRAVLTSILERAAAQDAPATRLSMVAPELVTPPAPRPGDRPVERTMVSPELGGASWAASSAAQVADQYAEQRNRIAELQRVAQQSAQRELVARAEAQARAASAAAQAGASTPADAASTSEAAARAHASRVAQAAQAARASQVTDAAQAAQIAEAQAAQEAREASSVEVRVASERAELELRQRIAAGRAAEVQRQAETAAAATGRTADVQRQADAGATAAERARLEERISQRLAERGSAQRLHEQARAEAAAHARASAGAGAWAVAGGPAARADVSAAETAPAAASQAPAEIVAAIAGLPPELAAMLGSTVTQRPDRTMQAIRELSETLRTVELLARGSAQGAVFEATRGPRLMMPAGLGGLVSAVDHAQSIAARPAMLSGQRPLAPLSQLVAPPQVGQAQVSTQASRDVRVPALPWLSPAARSHAASPTTALGAAATATPVALSHVAWADRWLARFAGAAPESLDMISAAAAAAPSARMQALAQAAPGAVFVVPELLRGDLAADRSPAGRAAASYAQGGAVPYGAAVATTAPASYSSAASTQASHSAAAPQVPDLRLINPAPSEPVRRFDDAEETPDDVFAAIAAAASQGRASARAAATSSVTGATGSSASFAATPGAMPGSIAAMAQSVGHTLERPTFADMVAHSAPSAPGAGLSAKLASSPFAPALRHVLPLPSSASFDVRALFGAGLGATYLAGLIGPALRELEIGSQAAPVWASWSEAPLNLQLGADRADRIDRMVPGFEAAYVGPEAFGARESGAASPAELEGAAQLHELEQLRDAMAATAAGAASVPAGASGSGSAASPWTADAASLASAAAAAELAALERSTGVSVTTLRSALLAWELASVREPGGASSAPQLVPATFATSLLGGAEGPSREAAQSTSAARMMIESMAMPMLGDVVSEQGATWAAPGMMGERAHAWAVAQERSASDLSLDFVTPELVLAARVYGLGPAEAAQAARLAIVGPSQLSAMASTVDRTFVEAMTIGREARSVDAERRARGGSIAAAGPTSAARELVAGRTPEATAARASTASPAATAAAASGEAGAPVLTAYPTAGGEIAAAIGPRMAAPPSSGAAFGVDRRAPRGAFLWPSATVAALGMTAAGSDGQLSMSVAALELLAAQVVAELGTFTALSRVDAATRGLAGDIGLDAELGTSGEAGAALGAAAHAATGAAASAGARPVLGQALDAGHARDASQALRGAEPGESDVLGAAAALVPAARRARFEALYVALGQSTAGGAWSPAARAARALALAGRADDVTVSARERAALAWDVLPVVYATDGAAGATDELAGSTAAAAAAELMSSYVAPAGLGGGGATTAAAGASGTARRAAGASAREYVSPGGSARSSGAIGAAASGDRMSPEPIQVSSSPGLAGLLARAGAALGSYVTPAPAAPGRERSSDNLGAVLRAPTAAPEYVQTGRSAGRFGGGEVEIPAWFESAARKMLTERSGGGDGISLAELTLVTAAPASHIAASTRSAPSAASASAGASSEVHAANTPKIDVEKLANELYRDIMVLMDVARSRNGDPYL